MFEIENGVPMPDNTSISKYPFSKMEVGDSFAFDAALRKALQAASCWHGKRNNKKFSIRSIGNGTCRIWRVE